MQEQGWGFRWAVRLRRWAPWIAVPILGFLFLLLLLSVHDLARELTLAEVGAAVRDTNSWRLGLAALFTALSFVAMTGYDRSALRYAGAPGVPYRIVGQAAYIAFALSNTIGFGLLTGGAVRMRLYGAAGVEPARIARAIAFNGAAFGIGTAVCGALAILLAARPIAATLSVSPWMLGIPACAVLAAVAGLLMRARGGPLSLGGLRIELPTPGLAIQQLFITAFDLAASAAVLWVLLPSGSIGFLPFLAFFCVAVLFGVASHLPGGIGVFEVVMLGALRPHVEGSQLAGALVLYRVIFYVLPLGLAVAWLVAHEFHRAKASPVVRAMTGLAPVLLAAFTLVVAVMLLVSGAMPATREATAMLQMHIPLPVVEASHFLGSVAGIVLLFVARGLLERLDAAWWAALLLGVLSFLLAVPKGVAIWEAAMLAAFVLLLAASRAEFTRKASLFAQPFSIGWTAAFASVLAIIVVLLFFVYREVDYSRALWWRFEFDGHAPRSLRAMLAVTLVALVLAMRQLFRPASPPPRIPGPEEMARVASIVQEQDHADAGVALLGDKQFIFADAADAFVMYGRRGHSWVALFDPVGAPRQAAELIWKFIETARAAGARASFYQVRSDYLPLYLDAGLRLLKLGEYASVPLRDFSLTGARRAGLRHGVNRAEREGLSFRVLPVESVSAVLPGLKQVSDAWLGEHHTVEKGFSLGAFAPDYVARQPVAVVHQGERLVAFATLMLTARKAEASVDLMRHFPDAPKGTMDYLFTRLLLHCQAEGFARFGLGMAPLSGMAQHPLAPNWHRLGRLLYAHGENFYNFQGLRAFKEKFDPEWQPRYLAAHGVVAPLLVLVDTAALISGGLRPMLTLSPRS